MNPRLSVIVPVYNTEKYINKCLKSITNQTYRNLEIIVIDDGSTDSSFTMCKKIEKEDPRVMVVRNEGKGVSAARNLGIKIAKGELLTFVDSDDYLELEAYEKAISEINACDAIFFGYFEENDRFNNKIAISPSRSGEVGIKDAIYSCMLPDGNNYFVSVWNKIFRREKIENVTFDESFTIGEDEVWLIQVIKRMTKIKLLSKPLYHYVQRQNSSLRSIRKINDNWQSVVLAKEKTIQLIMDEEVCKNHIKAKGYNDLFGLVIYAYIANDNKKSKIVHSEIRKYKKYFLESNEYSYKRKIKFELINILIKIRFSKKALIRFWNTTTQTIKLNKNRI